MMMMPLVLGICYSAMLGSMTTSRKRKAVDSLDVRGGVRIKCPPCTGNIAVWEGRIDTVARIIVGGMCTAAAWHSSHLLDFLLASKDTLYSTYRKYHSPSDPHWDFSHRRFDSIFIDDEKLRDRLRSEYIEAVSLRVWHILVERDPELSRLHTMEKLHPPSTAHIPLRDWFPMWVSRIGEVAPAQPALQSPAWDAHIVELGSRIANDLSNIADERECTIMCFLQSKRWTHSCLRELYHLHYLKEDKQHPIMAEITDGTDVFSDWGMHYEYRRRLCSCIWQILVQRYSVLADNCEYLKQPKDDLTFLGQWFPRWIQHPDSDDYIHGALELPELPWLGGGGMEIDGYETEEQQE